MGPGCGIKCRYNCKQKITPQQRDSIFQSFWEPGCIENRRSYVTRHTLVLRTRNQASRKKSSIHYFLTVGENKFRVCKEMFSHTLAISEKFIRTTLDKVDDYGDLERDKRGHHGNQPVIEYQRGY